MTRNAEGNVALGAAAPLERVEKVRQVFSAGERLLSDLDEPGLSLAATHWPISLDIVLIEDRGRSSKHF